MNLLTLPTTCFNRQELLILSAEYICMIQFLEYIVDISLNSINRLVFEMKMHLVFYDAGSDILNAV
jgi:hypothetical protein